MTPFILYALFAGLFGLSIHKRWYGIAAFAVCLIVWMLLMQCIIAYAMHPVSN
jgi:hypothetical protein